MLQGAIKERLCSLALQLPGAQAGSAAGPSHTHVRGGAKEQLFVQLGEQPRNLGIAHCLCNTCAAGTAQSSISPSSCLSIVMLQVHMYAWLMPLRIVDAPPPSPSCPLGLVSSRAVRAALGGMCMEVGVTVLPAALERVGAQLHALAAIANQVSTNMAMPHQLAVP